MRIAYKAGAIAFRLGRGFVHLHLGFFIAAAILTFPFWRSARPEGLAVAAIVVAALFCSILLHELAHAAVARRYHVAADRIDIDIHGGVVHLAGRPRTLGRDLAITIAGPLANIAVGFAAFGLLAILRGPGVTPADILQFPTIPPGIVERAIRACAWINIGFGLLNLLPGIPLDGGRLVYLLVEHRWNSRIAMRVVGGLGLVFATLNTFVFVGTLLAGFPIWAPPGFKANWRAFQAARTRAIGWNAFAV